MSFEIPPQAKSMHFETTHAATERAGLDQIGNSLQAVPEDFRRPTPVAAVGDIALLHTAQECRITDPSVWPFDEGAALREAIVAATPDSE